MPDCLLPELERMLVSACERRQAASVAPRPWTALRRLRTRTAVALGVAALAAGAAAATAPWQPLLGNEDQGRPTAGATPLDQATLALLSVLRRPQLDGDRGAAVALALRSIGEQNHGIRLPAVRRLEDAAAGAGAGAVVLVPVERFADDQAGSRSVSVSDGLCVFYPAVNFAGYPCWTSDDVRRGSAVARTRAADGIHAYGLAPDGVAAVEFRVGGRRVSAPVRANFFDAVLPAEAPPLAPLEGLRWRDPAGFEVPIPRG
jgi:hypothetical protein